MPRVEFTYSSVYDEQWRAAWKRSAKRSGRYPSPEEVQRFMRKVERAWRRSEAGVFRSIARVSGLRWSDDPHVCYVVGYAIPFSDPLTLPVFGPKAPVNYVVDVLTHELIHRLLIGRRAAARVRTALSRLKREYPRENENVRTHIIVHAIHWRVFETEFGVARLHRERRIMGTVPDYRRAWEIVEAEGAAPLIQRFLRR